MEAARYANSLLPCVVVMPKFVRKQNVLYNSVRTLRKNWENSNYNNACRQWSTELGNLYSLLDNAPNYLVGRVIQKRVRSKC